MGVVIGLLVGVGLALLVAWYLTRSQPQEKPGIRAPSAPSFMKPVPQKADKEEEETSVAPPKVDLNRPLQGKELALEHPTQLLRSLLVRSPSLNQRKSPIPSFMCKRASSINALMRMLKKLH